MTQRPRLGPAVASSMLVLLAAGAWPGEPQAPAGAQQSAAKAASKPQPQPRPHPQPVAVDPSLVTVDDGETYGPFEAGTSGSPVEVRFTGRLVRIDAERTTGGNTGAAEIEVYETP